MKITNGGKEEKIPAPITRYELRLWVKTKQFLFFSTSERKDGNFVSMSDLQRI